MHVHDAISRITEIHDHLARSEVYRGYRATPIAATGAASFVGAFCQSSVIDPLSGRAFVLYWTAIAAVAALVTAPGIVRRYVSDGAAGRRRARRTHGQFVPALLVGALVTFAAVQAVPDAIVLLPGIWSMLFGLGVLSSRPFLPRAIGWVALFYLICGGTLLLSACSDAWTPLSPWGMGITFGIGQVLGALVLYWKIERADA